MMKKITVLFLALMMSAFVVVGCGNESEDETTGTLEISQTTTEKPTQKPTQKATEKATQKATEKPTKKATEKATEKPTQKPTQKKNTANSGNSSQQNNNQTEVTIVEVPVEQNYEQQQIVEQQPVEHQQQVEQQQPVEQQQQQQQQQQVEPNVTPNNNQNEVPSFKEEDMSINYNNAKISLDKRFSDISSSLGNPDSRQENPSCGLSDNGKGFVYVYGNLTINTYMRNNVEYVETIFVEGNSSAKTDKSIVVGSNASDVKAKYGNPTSEDEMIMIYSIGDKQMMFYLENGNVSGVFIGR